MEKPNAPATERNRDAIHEVIAELCSDEQNEFHLFEIGSGTGQHAAYITPQIENLTWHVSDLEPNHEGIKAWTDDIDKVLGPYSFKVGEHNELPVKNVDFVFSANILHIMHWKLAQQMFKVLSQSLESGSLVLFYGPFNYRGEYTSKGNERLDQWLKERFKDGKSAIRDFEEVNLNMSKLGFILQEDREMPANNRMLIFYKL